MPSQLSDVERGYRRQPDEAHEGEGVYTSRLFDPLLCRPEGLMGKLKRTKWHKNEAQMYPFPAQCPSGIISTCPTRVCPSRTSPVKIRRGLVGHSGTFSVPMIRSCTGITQNISWNVGSWNIFASSGPHSPGCSRVSGPE
jgi:hypothetical protein